MGVEKHCEILCRKLYSKADVDLFKEKIDDQYNINWVLDNLPAATVFYFDKEKEKKNEDAVEWDGGLRVGRKEDNIYYLYNHMRVVVGFHKADDGSFEGKRVVRFEVEPFSIKHQVINKWDEESPLKNALETCKKDTPVTHESSQSMALEFAKDQEKLETVFTYDVVFVELPEVRWATRWDIYLSMDNRYHDSVHWFSIVNSVLIVLFLTGMVAMIMTRTLNRDIQRYNRVPTEEERAEEREESGWKLVHGDVFRPPVWWPMMFCVMIGTGTQVFVMMLSVLAFAVLGFVSPANRGSLMVALLTFWTICGIVGGYNSARCYKMFGGLRWQRCTLLTAFFWPGLCFAEFFILNLFVWGKGSSGAVPFTSMLAMMALWFGVSVPLTFFGAYFGYKRDPIEQPVATHDIPRQIPEQPWYMQPMMTVLVGGILPFGAVFVELFFILTSIWMDQYYYVFGFLGVVGFILIITCAEITIVLCYFQLCGEDYRWWWRSFLTSGASAFYLFAYSGFYFMTRLEITGFIPTLLYFGYMAMLSAFFFLFTGVIGFFACLWFNIKIYGSVKVD